MSTWFLTPGILHDPAWPDGWTDRGVTNLMKRGFRAEKFETAKQYPGLRWLTAKKRGRQFAEKIREYVYDAGMGRIIIVGHSNGTVTTVDALKEPLIRADVVNLVAAACDRDFNKNGLNNALLSGRVGKVNIWISGKDSALVLANWSKRLFGWTGYSFGTLGRDGPLNVHDEVRERVNVIHKPDWEHSTYWSKEVFPVFMAELVSASA